MARQRMKLTFPPDLMNTPLVYTLGKQFPVVTNIRRANVEKSGDRGWIILEISGSDEEDRARTRLGQDPGRARRRERRRTRQFVGLPGRGSLRAAPLPSHTA